MLLILVPHLLQSDHFFSLNRTGFLLLRNNSLLALQCCCIPILQTTLQALVSGQCQGKGTTYRGKPRFNKAKPHVAKSSFGTPNYVAGQHSSNESRILGASPSSNQQLCHICGKGFHSAIDCGKRFTCLHFIQNSEFFGCNAIVQQ
ncbi:hypothetical protein LIER_13493 [Lithospermum erythrorhizon]|uniref:Uncharacterized protein n=1 Tax=Lithospermum erythrorhizon TaxID=34254 RepID=A0AAV3Q0V1_LITER